MNLCNDGHHEVCYENIFCPCCLLLEQIKHLKDKTDDEIDALQYTIDNLKDKLKTIHDESYQEGYDDGYTEGRV